MVAAAFVIFVIVVVAVVVDVVVVFVVVVVAVVLWMKMKILSVEDKGGLATDMLHESSKVSTNPETFDSNCSNRQK